MQTVVVELFEELVEHRGIIVGGVLNEDYKSDCKLYMHTEKSLTALD